MTHRLSIIASFSLLIIVATHFSQIILTAEYKFSKQPIVRLATDEKLINVKILPDVHTRLQPLVDNDCLKLLEELLRYSEGLIF